MTLLFLSDCGILQFNVSLKSEQIGAAHSWTMQLESYCCIIYFNVYFLDIACCMYFHCIALYLLLYISVLALVMQLYFCMYILYVVTNLALWLQENNKLYLLTYLEDWLLA